uniref:Uncharacterized protein n=1 Tax=Anguilla anguilla TaxID=7936 RepID=A0A0E9RUT3_ANGAN
MYCTHDPIKISGSLVQNLMSGSTGQEIGQNS